MQSSWDSTPGTRPAASTTSSGSPGSRVLLCAETLFGEDLVEGVRAVATECPDLVHLVVIGTPQPSEGLLAHDMTARWMGKHPELGRVSFVNEQIALSGHTGTHLDATRGCGATGTGSTPRHAAPS